MELIKIKSSSSVPTQALQKPPRLQSLAKKFKFSKKTSSLAKKKSSSAKKTSSLAKKPQV